MKGGGKCSGDPMKITGMQIGKYYIGECAYSGNFYVYKVCSPSDITDCDDLLAKVYKITEKGWITEKVLETETAHMYYINSLGIAPKFYGLKFINYNDGLYGILLMEHYGGKDLKNSGTLDELLHDLTESGYDMTIDEKGIKSKIKQLLDILYDHNLQYNDLHSHNFLYKKIDDTYEFKIIDFGDVTVIPADKRIRRNYEIEIVSTKGSIDVSRGGGKKYKRKSKTRKYFKLHE
uniref:Protein kinase domain-containing protein n=1 Tax=viral metagenome TaxID=1070528 RepID=A0A6C0B8J7_9ZZZZ